MTTTTSDTTVSKNISGNSFSDVYQKMLSLVYDNYEYESKPRDMKIRECLNVSATISDIRQNLCKTVSVKNKIAIGYTKKEICLYLAAENKSDRFIQASKFWKNIQNPDNTINSAYGNLIFSNSLSDETMSQFDWAFNCLKSDRDSRQAFMRYNNNSHQKPGVKDLPCTFIQIFHIRNNMLHSTVMMRSNDVTLGTIHDIPSFILFQYLMYLRLKELNEFYDLKLGSYTHIANSLHLYERDFSVASDRLESGFVSEMMPLPNNWRVIKSNDIQKIISMKFDNNCNCKNKCQDCNCKNTLSSTETEETVTTSWEYPENIDFYNWLLK